MYRPSLSPWTRVAFAAVLLCALVLAVAPSAFSASPIYVRPGGDDTNCDGAVDLDYPGGGPGLACAVKTIQKGIDLVDASGTIHVAAGTYAGNITINKSLTLLGDPGDASAGPGLAAPVIDGGSAPGDAFLIANGVSNVTIQGFEIRNFTSNASGIGNGVSAWEASTSNITIQDDYFHNLGWNGVLVGNDGALGDHTNWTIKGNILETFAAYGFELTNASGSSIEGNVIHSDAVSAPVTCIMVDARRNESGITIRDNQIDGPMPDYPGGYAAIFIFADDFETPGANLNNVLVDGNTISTTGTAKHVWVSNYAGAGTVTGVKVYNNSLATLKSNTPAQIDASANWWGTNVAATVKTAANGGSLVDYTPWLDSGTDTAPGTAGFQGDFSTLWVDDDSPQTGSTGRIQEGINLVSGSTVNVAAGLYAERISIPKALTLLGATAGVSKKNYVAPTGYAYDPNVESIIKPATDALVPVIDVEKVGGGDIAGSITIKGFVLTDQGATNNDALRGLINLNIYTGLPDGILIENNVIGPHTGPAQNGLKGRGGISSEGPSNASRKNMVIKDNLIFDNLGDGVGIMLVGAYLSKGSTQDYSGARIENNTISGNTRSGIEIAGGVNGLVADPFVIANNTIKDSGWRIGYGLADYATKLKYGNGINFIRGGGETDSQNNGDPVARIPLYPFSSPTYVSITGNEVTHNEKNGIYMGPMPQHITVAGNKIQSNGTGGGSYQTWDGIRIDLEENYYGVPGVRPYTLPLVLDKFTDNVFNNNAITGNGDMGMRVVQTPTAPVDATSNWWGSACGPGPVGPGSGDKVSVNVVYSPWWTDASGGGTASEGTGGELVISAGASTATQNAVIACAAGKTVTYAGDPVAGGVVVNTNGVTINLNGATIGPGSPAFTINADDVTILGPGALDGWTGSANSASPGILVSTGADNFILQDVEVKRWADGVEVQGAHASLKLLRNWLHDNTDAGIQFNSDLTLAGVVTINGNLLKENGGAGINNLSAVTVPAAYNSWGDVGGPTGGDGVSGLVTVAPYTFSEVFVDVTPDTAATVREVNELDPFNVAVKVDAKGLYAVQYKLTYDPAYLTLQDSDGVAPGVQVADGAFKSAGSCTQTVTLGSVSVYCTRFAPDVDADGVLTISTLTFKADGPSLTGNGAWDTFFDLSVTGSELSSAARDGVKVYVNNGGFGAPSVTLGRTITDTPDDGQITIHGLANYTGYVDLQGRANDSGALLEVHASSTNGSTLYANTTSASSGKYTTNYVTPWQLVIGQTYWFQVDRALYLPTTVKTPVPGPYADSKILDVRPLTTLAMVVLLGGDATNDDLIDVSDAGCIGGDYGIAPDVCGTGGTSDVNGDGSVNILDLTLMGGNYTKTTSDWTP